MGICDSCFAESTPEPEYVPINSNHVPTNVMGNGVSGINVNEQTHLMQSYQQPTNNPIALPRLPFCIMSKHSNVTVEESSKIETLVHFAERHKLFLDQSRKAFLERHATLICDLVNGKLRNRNRFRELLLGVKAVGKSELCKILKSYMETMYDEVVTVYISYDSSDTLLSKSICEHLASKKNVCQSTIDALLSQANAQNRIEALEKLLQKNDIRLFLLVDEFHFVYYKSPEIGEAIVQEMSVICGTTLGYIHCIVTGSSSCLRSLAFAKLEPAKETNYKSYSKKVDLNSTKLQPKWIFPIIHAKDFRELLTMRNIELNDVATRYFCSGGRPGLAIEPPNIDEIPYSLSVKHLFTDDSEQAVVFRCIFDCMESFNITYDTETDEITALERDLVPIPESTLWERVQGLPNNKIDSEKFEHALFRLADEGVIIFHNSGHLRKVSISCSYVYVQLRQSRMNSLTWKEAAALKVPTGYFHEIAEDVAFRFIRKQSTSLFGVTLQHNNSTVLNFGGSKNRTNVHDSTFTMDSELKDISNLWHKELFDGKDNCGGDCVCLVPVGDNIVKLLRFQLKLGYVKMTSDDVTKLKNDMFDRGDKIVSKLKAKYSIAEYVCYLITTRYVESNYEESELDSSSTTNNYSRGFKILGPQELAKANVWSKEVMSLGKPYSSNRNLNYDLSL